MKTTQFIKQLVGSKFFTVEFLKKDGSKRKMLCKLGVKKHLKGGKLGYDADKVNNLIVFDVNKKAYRTVNLDTLKKLKCGKIEVTL